jgi:hypothetical protein
MLRIVDAAAQSNTRITVPTVVVAEWWRGRASKRVTIAGGQHRDRTRLPPYERDDRLPLPGRMKRTVAWRKRTAGTRSTTFCSWKPSSVSKETVSEGREPSAAALKTLRKHDATA